MYIYENDKYLKSTSQIEDYFKEDMYDLFDCGQGYYQEEAKALCKIQEKYYEVILKADVVSEKRDRGDRLYWVEDIESVTWKEIPKPIPKETWYSTYQMTINEDEKNLLDSFLKENNIKFNHYFN